MGLRATSAGKEEEEEEEETIGTPDNTHASARVRYRYLLTVDDAEIRQHQVHLATRS
jgi:hypothetical protein